ncbi:MAG: hypothetical protein JW850_02060 [Thermoflexales bacterium]|nr:hypothetical protein [Thermoflexales bacterium]
MDLKAVWQAVLGLDAWLDTMRGPGGYGGPVAHWWQNCLQFTGAGLDWRYEGIVAGYLNLYKQTGEIAWLAKARRAGDDLLAGQLPSGNFRNSSFELNPYPGGTPHEAACDLALLRLAAVLREQGDPAWQPYLAAAQRNLHACHIERLWDPRAASFRDDPAAPSLVPNKAATLVEAILALARLTGDEAPAEAYALPTLEAILAHQVRGGPLDGAIYQNSFGPRRVAKFFPYYVARCVPGLVAGYEWSRAERYLEAARAAVACVWRWRYEDGSFPQVIYPGGRVNRYPQWIAAVGDVVRVGRLLEPYGLELDWQPSLDWLLRGQVSSGAFRTAHGFASQISQRPPGRLPEFRDLLPACGWGDKAFRCLTELLPAGQGCSNLQSPISNLQSDCVLRGKPALYREDGQVVELRRGSDILYRWRKGHAWAEICAPELWWK